MHGLWRISNASRVIPRLIFLRTCAQSPSFFSLSAQIQSYLFTFYFLSNPKSKFVFQIRLWNLLKRHVFPFPMKFWRMKFSFFVLGKILCSTIIDLFYWFLATHLIPSSNEIFFYYSHKDIAFDYWLFYPRGKIIDFFFAE